MRRPKPFDGLPASDVVDVLQVRADITRWWTPERIALLAEVVLRLAGRWTAMATPTEPDRRGDGA